MSSDSFDLSDWKNTKIPRLAQLDSLQRCLICKDFLKAPVMTSCNHTFCSQCIRQHLLSVSRCPLCKSEQFESNLKRVILLEEIVTCFQSLRQDLIDLAMKKEDLPTKTEDLERNLETPNTPKTSRNTSAIVGTSQGDKSSPSADDEVIEILDDDSPATDGSVKCPVCGDAMSADFLQRKHLDDCLRGIKRKAAPKRKRSEISLFFQRKRTKEVDHEQFYFAQAHKHHHEAKRLPKMDFASVSTPKLKEKMAALKLSVQGTRSQLELRYNQYYLLFNSNLDSNRPVSELEVRQKLNQWEKSHLAFSAASGANTIFGDSLAFKNIADKDFPGKAWQEKYREEFRELVIAARKSRKGSKQPASGTENEDKEARSDETEMSEQLEATADESNNEVKTDNEAKSDNEHFIGKEKKSESAVQNITTESESRIPKHRIESDFEKSSSPSTLANTKLDPGAGFPTMGLMPDRSDTPGANSEDAEHPASKLPRRNTRASGKTPISDEVLDFTSSTLFVPH